MPDMHGMEGQTLVANGTQISPMADERDDSNKPLDSPEVKAETEEYWRHMTPYNKLDHHYGNRTSEADSSSSIKAESDTSSMRSPASPSYERSMSYGSLEGTPYLHPLPSLANLARSPVTSFHSNLVSAASGAAAAAMKMPPGGFGVKPHDHSTPDQNGLRDVYYCHLCTFVGQAKSDFDEHMSTHFEHQCPNCDYTSRTEGRLKRHIKDFHSDPDDPEGRREQGKPKVMRCRQCNFATEDKYEFWNHQRSHIKDEKMLSCPKCPFVTEYKHHLEYHLRNHFGSKPFKCERCNYSCVNKSMLNSHMKSHTNVYQYRCADCTYATKYCHSLKLHLKKYNHNPATVLNPDGSLPTDGSGDFELVSKRGPPRGPRGPRKDQKSPPPGYTPNMPPMPTQMPMQGLMPGMPALWPLMHNKSMFSTANGLPTLPPPSLLSMPGMPGMPTMPGMPPMYGMPLHMLPGLEGLRHMDAEDSPGSAQCYLCDYSSSSQHRLLTHVLQAHPLEHQQLQRMYGTSNPIHDPSLAKVKDAHFDMNRMFAAAHSTPSPKMAPPHKSSHSPQMSAPEVLHKKTLAADLAASIEAEAKHNGEFALDLTKSSTSEDGPHTPSDYSQNKRKIDDCASSSDGEQNEQSVGDDSTPRKRSRKGKAYKLDTLCLKLQKQCSSPQDNDYESDVYGSDYDESSPDSDRMPMSTPAEKTNSTMDTDPKAAFEQLQQNLAVLNGTVPIQALNGVTKDEGKDSGNEDHNSTDNSEHVKSADDLKVSPIDPVSVYPVERGQKTILQVSRRLEPHFANTLSDISEEAMQLGNFECGHCGIAFRDCVMYTVHMGYHGYKDPFKCNMCGHLAENSVEFFLHIARAAHD